MRKKYSKSFFSLLLAFALVLPVLPSRAADGGDTITKELLFSTDQEEIDESDAFEPEIRENGKLYRLQTNVRSVLRKR